MLIEDDFVTPLHQVVCKLLDPLFVLPIMPAVGKEQNRVLRRLSPTDGVVDEFSQLDDIPGPGTDNSTRFLSGHSFHLDKVDRSRDTPVDRRDYAIIVHIENRTHNDRYIVEGRRFHPLGLYRLYEDLSALFMGVLIVRIEFEKFVDHVQCLRKLSVRIKESSEVEQRIGVLGIQGDSSLKALSCSLVIAQYVQAIAHVIPGNSTLVIQLDRVLVVPHSSFELVLALEDHTYRFERKRVVWL
jgi:hypothetical protein